MLRRLLCLTAVASLVLFGQDAKYERVAAAGRLWAKIRYFHPWVAGKETTWDAAFASTVPRILASRDKTEYEAALGQLLASLDDPLTRIGRGLLEGEATDPERKEPASLTTTDDGILILRLGSGSDAAGIQKQLELVVAGAKSARGIVIDARGYNAGGHAFDALRIHDHLVSTPGIRRRVYSGYQWPNDFFSDGNFSGFVVEDGKTFPRKREAPIGRPVVYVADGASIHSRYLLGLQAGGLAAIVVEGHNSEDAFVPRATVDMGEGIEVAFRSADIVYEDGTVGFEANEMVSSSGLQAALEIARKERFAPPQRRTRSVTAAPLIEWSGGAPEAYPSIGLRALAAAKVWAAFAFFYPYQRLMGEDWDGVFRTYLARAIEATDEGAFHSAIAEMVTKSHDSHSFVSSAVLAAIKGVGNVPVFVRSVEGKPVVVAADAPALEAGITVGDVILSIDGKPPSERIAFLQRYIATSTPQSVHKQVLPWLLAGEVGSKVEVDVDRGDGRPHRILLSRVANANTPADRTGEPIRLINGSIGYVDLDRLPRGRVDEMFEKLRDTKAIILDLRGYPLNTGPLIAPRLTSKPVVMSEYRRNVATAEQITARVEEQRIAPSSKWKYAGRTLVLIDERAMSQSEHNALAYKAANGSTFVGTATTGADGSVLWTWLPGNIRVSFASGGVWYPDGSQLQRVGVRPDFEAAPTIRGIREGKDEVLDRAIALASRLN